MLALGPSRSPHFGGFSKPFMTRSVASAFGFCLHRGCLLYDLSTQLVWYLDIKSMSFVYVEYTARWFIEEQIMSKTKHVLQRRIQRKASEMTRN